MLSWNRINLNKMSECKSSNSEAFWKIGALEILKNHFELLKI